MTVVNHNIKVLRSDYDVTRPIGTAVVESDGTVTIKILDQDTRRYLSDPSLQALSLGYMRVKPTKPKVPAISLFGDLTKMLRGVENEQAHYDGFLEEVLHAVNDATEKKIQNANARIDQARNIVWMYAQEHLDKTDGIQLDPNDVYVVWFNYTLGNWKALVSTNLPDGMYYEVTYNLGKNEIYLDVYKKFENRVIQQAQEA